MGRTSGRRSQGAEFARRMAGELPSLEEAEATFATWLEGNQKVATRKASELALEVLPRWCPNWSAVRPT
jgi:transketolase